MEKIGLKYKLLTVLCFFTLVTWSQFGVNGSLSFLRPFGVKHTYAGLQVGGELLETNESSKFLRLAIYGRHTEDVLNTVNVIAFNPMHSPYSKTIYFQNTMNYFIIEGGNRYYVVGDYESGFGVFGGGNFSGIFNSVRRVYSDYDKVIYGLPSDQITKGTIANLAFGFNVGAKYTFTGIGSVFFDTSLSFVVLNIAGNSTAAGISKLYSPLLFTFNLGFRKDLY
jgi:hypothetical protein